MTAASFRRPPSSVAGPLGGVSWPLFALCLACCCWTPCLSVRGAPPIIRGLEPPRGPDTGGYELEIRGRNLAFLDGDCQVYMNDVMQKQETTFVRDPWDRLVTSVTECARCGVVQVYVACGGVKSNVIEYTMDNTCYGPLAPGLTPVVPVPFSGQENCTVCEQLVHLTVAVAPEMPSYQALQTSMNWACYTQHFRRYTLPQPSPNGKQCTADFEAACQLMVASSGDDLLDNIWNEWDEFYWVGGLPRRTCEMSQKCPDLIISPGMNGMDETNFPGEQAQRVLDPTPPPPDQEADSRVSTEEPKGEIKSDVERQVNNFQSNIASGRPLERDAA